MTLSEASAVMRKTGIFSSRPRSAKACSTWMPSISGMITSSRTAHRLSCFSKMASSPARPSGAVAVA